MKKIKTPTILFSICCFLSILGLVWFFLANSPVCSVDCQNKIFIIKKGESLGEIAQNLEEEGLVRSSLAFQFVAAKLGISRQIQAGDFRLNPGMSLKEIAQELTLGTLDKWVTLIEGWRREQIAIKLVAELGGEKSLFNQAEFLSLTRNLEGQLFPDTYLIPREADAQKVVDSLMANFDKKTKDLGVNQQALILASIIEREAKFAEDRPLVAGILLNRLNLGMPLQVDATVQYAIATQRCSSSISSCDKWWSENLTKEDLRIDSPYNTYLYAGLPPAPICSPGLASIKASLAPQETDYLFYLSDREGKMHYAETFEEHNLNIKKYLY